MTRSILNEGSIIYINTLSSGEAIEIVQQSNSTEAVVNLSMRENTTEQTTPANTDWLLLSDNSTGKIIKRIQYSNLKDDVSQWTFLNNLLYPDATGTKVLMGRTSDAGNFILQAEGNAYVSKSIVFGSFVINNTDNDASVFQYWSNPGGNIGNYSLAGSFKPILGKIEIEQSQLVLPVITGTTNADLRMIVTDKTNSKSININSPALNSNITVTLPGLTGTILTDNYIPAPNKGGTGQTSYTNGQLLIGNTTGNTLSKSTLTAGTNVSITNSTGSITIASTNTNTEYSAGTNLTLSGTQFSLTEPLGSVVNFTNPPVFLSGCHVKDNTDDESSGIIKFFENSDNGVNTISLTCPTSIGSNQELILPEQSGPLICLISPLVNLSTTALTDILLVQSGNDAVKKIAISVLLNFILKSPDGSTLLDITNNGYKFNNSVFINQTPAGSKPALNITGDTQLKNTFQITTTNTSTVPLILLKSSDAEIGAGQIYNSDVASGEFLIFSKGVLIYQIPNTKGDGFKWIDTSASGGPKVLLQLTPTFMNIGVPIISATQEDIGSADNKVGDITCEDIVAEDIFAEDVTILNDSELAFSYTSSGTHSWSVYQGGVIAGTLKRNLHFDAKDTVSSSYGGKGFINVQATGYILMNFTGQHRCIPVDKDLYNNIDNYIGMVVESTGKYNSIIKENNISQEATIDESQPEIQLSSTSKSKKVYGVISKKEDKDIDNQRTFEVGCFTSIVGELLDERLIINSIGEGGILVCNENGNIENGDLLCSSSITGIAMKQDTDFIMNYTIGKSTQDYTFNIDETKLIGCVYYCG